jgi:hypothetical protein
MKNVGQSKSFSVFYSIAWASITIALGGFVGIILSIIGAMK